MTLMPAQGAPQSRFYPRTDGIAFAPRSLADFSDQRNGELDGEDPLDLWNRQKPTSNLGLPKVAVSLTSRNALVGDKPVQDLWKGGSLPE
jgi:hypothetical protein